MTMHGRISLGLLLMTLALSAQAARVLSVRAWTAEDGTRLVLDLDRKVDFRQDEPPPPGRLVLILPDSSTRVAAQRWPANVGIIQRVLTQQQGRELRLDIDLSPAANAKVFALPPAGRYGHRLVVELKPASVTTAMPALTASAPLQAPVAPVPPAVPPVAPPPPAKPAVPVSVPVATPPRPAPLPVAEPPAKPAPKPAKPSGRGRDMIITVDAGHGGEDPGAIGRDGTREKVVTLAIAKHVVDYLNAQEGITAHLTRDGDFFIPLQKRRQIGRYEHRADIFLSVHADSAPSRAAKGASVFALSIKGAGAATSRFAQQLAEQENRSDLVGGVAVERDDLGSTLANLLVEGTLKQSLDMGRMILKNIEPTVGRLHTHRVEQAGFAVLKEPGMVSLLVETGFISNPDEEARLKDPAYQQALAEAIGQGVVTFCKKYPMPGTAFSRD